MPPRRHENCLSAPDYLRKEQRLASLSESQLLYTVLGLAIILTVGRGMAEVARRLGQPEVLGELIGGFLLGPSVFGALIPVAYKTVFLAQATGTVFSGLSWIGAILLLLAAGLEVDLHILRARVRPGILAAAFAIVPSLFAGTFFAWKVLGRVPPNGVFLGIVLSVTGVSVISKILMEMGTLRRDYGQVILAAGVTSEVIVWLFVSIVSSIHSASPALAGLRSLGFALAFILLVMTVGRRFTFWAMRRVSDVTWIVNGQLSLVIVLAFLAAAITQALGLHALLGAFFFGVLLAQAPRANTQLLENLQTVTVGVFAPIFFVLAGMRVDILRLGSFHAIAITAALLVTATVVKVSVSALGARLGSLRWSEAALVGVGLTLKGGTDVIVAIIGVELGVLTNSIYTMYAVVAIVTVLFSPVLIRLLTRWAPPTEEEAQRLERDEAARRSYMPRIERILIPVLPELMSTLAASVVEEIARSKSKQDQIVDMTELVIKDPAEAQVAVGAAQETAERLNNANQQGEGELESRTVKVHDPLDAILNASSDYDLIAIGARPPHPGGSLSLGSLQDRVIDRASADVLVAVDDSDKSFDCQNVKRILVPTNGLEYSMAAGDLAGSLAEACGAEVVIFHVVQPAAGEIFWQQRDQQQLVDAASRVVDELAFRLTRMNVKIDTKRQVSGKVGKAIVRELGRGDYGLVVMGGTDRGGDGRLYLGRTVQHVLTEGETPAVLLVTHG